MVMVNLGSTDDSRYTGYREITDRDVLDLQCICLCIKYESNTLIFSKVMERKPFFKVEKGP